MTDARVQLHERPHEETCPFCHDAIASGQETWPCDKCGTKLHAECFHDNHMHCTVLGCGGRAIAPATLDHSNDPRFSIEARQQRAAVQARRRALVEEHPYGQPVRRQGTPPEDVWALLGLIVVSCVALGCLLGVLADKTRGSAELNGRFFVVLLAAILVTSVVFVLRGKSK